MIIVPEETAFYRTSFDDDADFEKQLNIIYDTAEVKNQMLRYQLRINILFFLLVVKRMTRFVSSLSSTNSWLRDDDFVKQHGESLKYKPTRE